MAAACVHAFKHLVFTSISRCNFVLCLASRQDDFVCSQCSVFLLSYRFPRSLTFIHCFTSLKTVLATNLHVVDFCFLRDFLFFTCQLHLVGEFSMCFFLFCMCLFFSLFFVVFIVQFSFYVPFATSCSEDGTVVVTGLQPTAGGEQPAPEVYSYGAKWPMLAVRLDPLYARR